MSSTTVLEIESKVGRKTLLKQKSKETKDLSKVLFITSYPPRECGIATYSQDLIKALGNKFSSTFSMNVCALESGIMDYTYPEEVKYRLDTTNPENYHYLLNEINQDLSLSLIVIQHEFGFFRNEAEDVFIQFLESLDKPLIIVFHTVLPRPDESMQVKVQRISNSCESIIVMTNNSAHILFQDYLVPTEKVSIIPHGTHLVLHLEKHLLKEKYNLTGRSILSTFGLLSSGKSIETTLNALPEIVKEYPEILLLVIGKTHMGVVQNEGEKYREMLEAKVKDLNLQDNVMFINSYLPLSEILEYLQLTDIYIFSSKDPNQAVSGTFSYAISCGCPVISTPIPHALEVLQNDSGIIFDFENSKQLGEAVRKLLGDETERNNISSNGLHRIAPTAWENAAIAHASLFAKAGSIPGLLHFSMPEISLNHVKKMTTDFAMLQFSKLNQPDIESGYTLDDNARALIALCMHYELTCDESDVQYIRSYLDFIGFCQNTEGYFLNYVDKDKSFTKQNDSTNLADSNGRAIWALGFLISKSALLPVELIEKAEQILLRILPRIDKMFSTRAMAFAIKGLYYSNLNASRPEINQLIKKLANRLVQMYRHESEHNWEWYESYLTYANSILPEAMLCAWLETGDILYRDIAKKSFDFLLSKTFTEDGIKVISNKTWLFKGLKVGNHGEQPIDVAYTILALTNFYAVFKDPSYADKLTTSFDWFLGRNHLQRIIYNPCTGGCYDGLEENHVNLNQGAESTLSYLLSRMKMEEYLSVENNTLVMIEGRK